MCVSRHAIVVIGAGAMGIKPKSNRTPAGVSRTDHASGAGSHKYSSSVRPSRRVRSRLYAFSERAIR